MVRIDIDAEACIGCRGCCIFCPEGVLDVLGEYAATVVAGEKCTACGACEETCPEGAIKIVS